MSFWLLLILLISTGSCIKKAENTSAENPSAKSPVIQENNASTLIQETLLPDDESQNISNLLSQITDFELGDDISLDSPKRFLQISILFTMEQTSNYYEITKKTHNDEQINDFLNKKREQFYKKLGISETSYIEYGINHSEEIQEFLAENPDFEIVYEQIQSQVTD